MRLIRNNIIPFGKFTAVNLFTLVFYKERIGRYTVIHESIHTEQMKELLFLPFYLWYVVEWLIKLVYYGSMEKAYMNISFEREAYTNQRRPTYLSKRRHYAWLKYVWVRG